MRFNPKDLFSTYDPKKSGRTLTLSDFENFVREFEGNTVFGRVTSSRNAWLQNKTAHFLSIFKPFCCWCQEEIPAVFGDPQLCQCGHSARRHRLGVVGGAFGTASGTACLACVCGGFVGTVRQRNVSVYQREPTDLGRLVTIGVRITCHGEVHTSENAISYEAATKEPRMVEDAYSHLFDYCLAHPDLFYERLKMPKMIASLIYDDLTDIWNIRVPYHPQWVDAFKKRVPSPARKYDPATKIWSVVPEFLDVAKELSDKYFGGWRETRPAAPPAQITAEASCFRAFLQVVPKDLIKKLYREASKSLHPDTGSGDAQAMSTLNAAYDALKKELGL